MKPWTKSSTTSWPTLKTSEFFEEAFEIFEEGKTFEIGLLPPSVFVESWR
jgi:hypothetical protein